MNQFFNGVVLEINAFKINMLSWVAGWLTWLARLPITLVTATLLPHISGFTKLNSSTEGKENKIGKKIHKKCDDHIMVATIQN